METVSRSVGRAGGTGSASCAAAATEGLGSRSRSRPGLGAGTGGVGVGDAVREEAPVPVGGCISFLLRFSNLASREDTGLCYRSRQLASMLSWSSQGRAAHDGRAVRAVFSWRIHGSGVGPRAAADGDDPIAWPLHPHPSTLGRGTPSGKRCRASGIEFRPDGSSMHCFLPREEPSWMCVIEGMAFGGAVRAVGAIGEVGRLSGTGALICRVLLRYRVQ